MLAVAVAVLSGTADVGLGIQAAAKAERSPALSLMPISFASILGGMITLIGTPPNIVIATFREDALGEPFGMFDFTPVGVDTFVYFLAPVVSLVVAIMAFAVISIADPITVEIAASKPIIEPAPPEDLVCVRALPEHAAEIAAHRLDVRQGDAGDLPWEDGTFDAVSIANALHLIDEPIPVPREACRVLKLGGRFVAITQAKEPIEGLLWAPIRRGMTLYSDAELGSLLSEVGLTEVEAYPTRDMGQLGYGVKA